MQKVINMQISNFVKMYLYNNYLYVLKYNIRHLTYRDKDNLL